MPVIRNDQPSPDDALSNMVSGKGSRSAVRLHQLRYFIAAADYGSFRKAAAALAIQESSISRRIRDLEDELGASLFVRYSGGVRLTVAGQEFLRNARHALRQIDIGVTKVAAVGRAEQGLIKIGIFSSLASGFLFDLLRTYAQRHPNVKIDIIDGSPPEHVAAVRNLNLDVAFITGMPAWDGCEAEHLWCEKVFLVLPDDHPLANKPDLGWADLASERFIVSDGAPGLEIHEYLVARLADVGRKVEIQTQQVGRDNILSLVAVGQGLTLTSEATTGAQFRGIAYRELADEILPFSMVWSAQNDNPACRRLLSLARLMATPAGPK
ncbi:LysR family transcriptional regulator [Parvibaculum sp.]|uniref:LysR family transcriptional regulator n=1 Tax=Parvibaculum sp. TaxID=2024848 RepID=UPI000C59E7EB|nr:LysR family transcriptional regulator [Parvibaculum sp.]MAM94513.1 LysR family transcriptional regulator [Parvibaculum sp.]|tara:strand:- start:72618 stop:73589 length:972 start_codon:yes stop_codon:yes gene_type:complete